ncbi:MAG: hypothetical protein U0414_21860 [Polyangiaceae bacterium]
MAKSSGVQLSSVDTRMAEALLVNGIRVFHPEQLGEKRAVSQRWRALAKEGKVTLDVTVYCQDGHEIWSGPAQDAKGPWSRCAECPEPDEIEAVVELRATITPAWEQELKSTPTPSKKKALR